MLEIIRNKLEQSTDEKYRDFNKSLVPGDMAPMLGVRLPKLREIAKEIAKENGREYIHALMEEEKSGHVYHEELLLHGIIIGYLKCEDEERKELLDGFVPVINNWAVCDSSCTTYKFMKKDMPLWFEYLMNYAQSDKEYNIRFAVVCMLDHFLTAKYIHQILEIMDEIHHDGYYVKMAVAWAVSVCYVKFPKETGTFLADNHLDDFTQNKSIQKIRESYRVSREDKDALLAFKR